jgi:hypothetical protein
VKISLDEVNVSDADVSIDEIFVHFNDFFINLEGLCKEAQFLFNQSKVKKKNKIVCCCLDALSFGLIVLRVSIFNLLIGMITVRFRMFRCFLLSFCFNVFDQNPLPIDTWLKVLKGLFVLMILKVQHGNIIDQLRPDMISSAF